MLRYSCIADKKFRNKLPNNATKTLNRRENVFLNPKFFSSIAIRRAFPIRVSASPSLPWFSFYFLKMIEKFAQFLEM